MSSSDSEGDSFLNIAQKLSAMKNNYRVENVTAKSNDSEAPVEATVSPSKRKNVNDLPAKSKRKKSSDSASEDSMDMDAFRSAFPPINEAKPKRTTRAAAKRKTAQSSPNLADSQLSLPPRRSRKSNSASTSTAVTEVAGNSSIIEEPPTPTRGRARGRGVRGRGRGRARGRNNRSRSNSNPFFHPSLLDIFHAIMNSSSDVPIYSVGNTDEYPDQSDSQQLFGNRKTNDVVEVEDLNESIEDNEELSVKVYWQSSDIYKFMIRRYQKLTVLFDFFSKKENVSFDKLLFTYNDKILKSDDTPDSINYSIVKFIDGGVVHESVTHLPASNEDKGKDGIKLKFQCQNVKKPFEIFVRPDDKMSTAMLRCAEHFEKPFDKMRFEFDGDTISGKSTAKDLDLEGGECIDVKILS